MNYYTYLKTLDTSHFADILIKELYKLAEGSETFSPTVGQLYKQEGKPGKDDLDYAIMNSKRGYTTAQLEQLAREQLKIELDGSITIKSIEKSKEFANSEKCVCINKQNIIYLYLLFIIISSANA